MYAAWGGAMNASRCATAFLDPPRSRRSGLTLSPHAVSTATMVSTSATNRSSTTVGLRMECGADRWRKCLWRTSLRAARSDFDMIRHSSIVWKSWNVHVRGWANVTTGS